MKTFKIVLSLVITVVLVYALNRSWAVAPGLTLPPIGKFLDPFHGFWRNSEKKTVIPETIEVPGLKGEVKVVYDSMLIPHIYATNEEDLYFTQGYVIASHRLWQMEMQTRGGSGRLAEVLGPQMLDFDRSQRRLGMVWAAEKMLKVLESTPETNMAITAYTNGVNAYIESLSDYDLPLEYKLLDFKPEPWKNFNTAMLAKNMAQTLNFSDKDKEMTNALTMVGKPMVDLLWPDNENSGDPIIDKPGGWKFPPIKFDTIPLALPNQLVKTHHLQKASQDVGSNNWAVSGRKTATGSPLLANDPHLDLSLPSLWFVVHLNAPGINTMGGIIPGAPGVLIGFTDSIAWGLTNAQRDLIDYYKVKFKDAKMNEYLSDDKWRPSTKIIEKIEVRGKSTFYDTVTYTHHGPVTFDLSYHETDINNLYAFRWKSHDPSNEIMTLYVLNHGRNYNDYIRALEYFEAPAHNIAFASVAGDIAMRVQGKFPLRRKDEGKFTLDGTKTNQEWQAFIPFEQNVIDKNPDRGFVSSANQYPADASYPYFITASSYEAYRNRRINQVLTPMVGATPQDMMNLQQDYYNIKASESLKFMMSQLESVSLKDAEKAAWNALKSWNLNNDAEQTGTTYFEYWFDYLVSLAWDEFRNDSTRIDYPSDFTTIKLLKEQPELEYFDNKSTPERETARDLVRKAFSQAVERLEKRVADGQQDLRWGQVKGTIIRHLARLEPLSVKVPYGGSGDVVNATTRSHGPSWRMVVSLEKTGLKAWGVYPGGQSGNPGSPFYSNMIPMWASGKYFSLRFGNAERVTPISLGTTTFKPAQQ